MNKTCVVSGGVVVIAHTEENKVVLVRDNTRPDPKWKFPGGGIEEKDSYVYDGLTGKQVRLASNEKLVAIRAGLRELEEETGLLASRNENGEAEAAWIGHQFRAEKRTYTHYILVKIDDFSRLKPVGNDGEETRVCSFSGVQSGEVEILRHHKNFIDTLPRQKEAEPA